MEHVTPETAVFAASQITEEDSLCIKGSFSAMQDASGAKFFSVLAAADPILCTRLLRIESKQDANLRYLNIIGTAVADLPSLTNVPPVAKLLGDFHRQNLITIDDYASLEEVLLSRIAELAVRQSQVYEGSVIGAWSVFLKNCWYKLGDDEAIAPPQPQGDQMAIVTTTFNKLKPSLLGKKFSRASKEFGSSPLVDILNELDGQSPGSHIHQMFNTLVTLWGKPELDEQLAAVKNLHRGSKLYQHYGMIEMTLHAMLTQMLTNDFYVIVADTKRAWRRMLRQVHQMICFPHLNHEAVVPQALPPSNGVADSGNLPMGFAPPPPMGATPMAPDESPRPQTAPPLRMHAEPNTPLSTNPRPMSANRSTARSDTGVISVRDITMTLLDDYDLSMLFDTHATNGKMPKDVARTICMARCPTTLDIDRQSVDRQLARFPDFLSLEQFSLVYLHVAGS